VWVNVSRNWAALESIFMASMDIRSQLPDDTKRFEVRVCVPVCACVRL
jgi:dynein heavy chain, axonemal